MNHRDIPQGVPILKISIPFPRYSAEGIEISQGHLTLAKMMWSFYAIKVKKVKTISEKTVFWIL